MNTVTDESLGAPVFSLLLDIDQRARSHASGLPQQRKAHELWHGIGFRCGGLSLLVEMDEVREVHPCTQLTSVPGAKPWVRGVANIRGNLTPVMDLAGFLGKSMASPGARVRMMVMNHPILNVALMVDELAGLRHFALADLQPLEAQTSIDDALRPYVKGMFHHNQQTWAVFAMQKLIQDHEFLNVAA